MSGSHDSSSFKVVDLLLPEAVCRIRVISIKHSFWGSAAGNVAKVCAELGSTGGIIYIAKLGAISQGLSIFDMVSPSEFMLWESSKINPIEAPPPFFELAILNAMHVVPTIHITLPTLIEETNVLLNHFSANGMETIDNEVSYIARSISNVNKRLLSPVRFSCLHIVTDKPSSSLIDTSSAREAVREVNHLLSKNSLQYRRQKNHNHNNFIEIFKRTITHERRSISEFIA